MIDDPARRLAARAREHFRLEFDGEGAHEAECHVAYAPGRVNLIGEHTDYNDGFVLPMAIDRGVAVAFRARPELPVVASSQEMNSKGSASLERLDSYRGSGWFDYVRGVAWAMLECGLPVDGADMAIDSDLPIGAGLSSSAALEVAVARALVAAAGGDWNPAQAARVCQRAESEFVGVPCGIMDQFAAAASEEGSALLLDCRSLEATPVSLPADAAVVVIDTGVRRRLASSEYADRRRACESAVGILRSRRTGIRALRDVSATQLDAARPDLDDATYRRALHVIRENERVLAFVEALRGNDLAAAGALLDASHESLRTLYEVSGPALDRVVAAARTHPACYGARMTGAGFGGCAIALVSRESADIFTRDLHALAASEGGSAFVVRASAGARIVE